MKKFFKVLSILTALALFATACSTPWSVQAQLVEQAAPNTVRYQSLLDQRMNAKDVIDFIASNNCTSSGQFQLCQPTGLAFWTDADQIVQIVYLYVSNSYDFATYKGELPFGLMSNDTMATVEQKMGQPNVQHALRPIWKPDLSKDGESPKHTYYQASYRRLRMTIVYKTTSASDTGASIYAILVSR